MRLKALATALFCCQALAFAADWPLPSDEPVITHHKIQVNGTALNYTAYAGFLSLNDEFNNTRGRIFYAFYRLDAGAESARPVTFAWNGGPGSNASLLELAALGPLRVKDLSEYSAQPPPYQLTENESTWLDKTDLVFVDPIGTGYSYATKPEFGSQFWSPKGDVASIAEFIRLFLSGYKYDRRLPIFLVGESYGTLRAAGVASELTGKDLNVSGVVLISSVLGPGRLGAEENSDLTYIDLLPSYTVAAFVQKKLGAGVGSDLETSIRKAEQWAVSQYSVALLEGDRLSPPDRDRIARDLANFTGLPEQFLMHHNLRMGMEDFANHLLEGSKRVVGHYDVRATAPATSSGGEYNPTLDPSLNTHGTGELVVPYLRDQLNIHADALYAGPFGGRWPPPASPRGDWMSTRWDWSSAAAVDGDAALARAMRANPHMQVLVVSGMYDLSTPFFRAEYAFAHMNLDPETRARVQLMRYPAGHMVYLEAPTRKRLKSDFVALMQRGSGPEAK